MSSDDWSFIPSLCIPKSKQFNINTQHFFTLIFLYNIKILAAYMSLSEKGIQIRGGVGGPRIEVRQKLVKWRKFLKGKEYLEDI